VDSLNAIGAGGLYATASDLAAFGGALTGTKLLKESSLEAMAYPEYSRGIWPDDTPWTPWPTVWAGDKTWSGSPSAKRHHRPDQGRRHPALSRRPGGTAGVRHGGGGGHLGGTSTYNQLAATQILAAAPGGGGRERGPDHPRPAGDGASSPAGGTEAVRRVLRLTSLQYHIELADDGTPHHDCPHQSTMVPAQTFTYCADGTFRTSPAPPRCPL
jgi:hypothetical protein